MFAFFTSRPVSPAGPVNPGGPTGPGGPRSPEPPGDPCLPGSPCGTDQHFVSHNVNASEAQCIRFSGPKINLL